MAAPYPQRPTTQEAVRSFDHSNVTAAFELPNLMITRNYGIVRGIIVRSRSVVGQMAPAFRPSSAATSRSIPNSANGRA